MGACSDPIAELLTKLRNAQKAQQRFIDVSWSNIKESIVKTLKAEGFVAQYLVKEEKRKKHMRVFLRYGSGRRPILNNLKRISRVSCRKYVGSDEIPVVMGGMGIAILSTPKGILDGRTAKEQNVGGELLCLAW